MDGEMSNGQDCKKKKAQDENIEREREIVGIFDAGRAASPSTIEFK